MAAALRPAAVAPHAFVTVLHDRRARAAVLQAAVLGAVLLGIALLASNAADNLARQNIATGFAFLWREAGFGISEHLIAYSPADTYARALLVGFLNTIRVAVAVSVVATILGLAAGIARLSENPLLAGIARVFVEVVRNVPLILQLFFWYAIVRTLPGPRQALVPVPGTFMSNRGVLVPSVEFGPGSGILGAAALAGLVGAVLLLRRARRLRLARGHAGSAWPAALASFLVPPGLALAVLPGALSVSVPVLQGFNFRGGTTISPEFAALFLGMTIYAAAFTAEIVRAGILAVPKGQWETASSLGLGRLRTLQLVVLPQSLRIAIPPLTSQYLNNTKNSSLAVAIGYPDLVSVSGTTMNQTGQAIEAILLFMSVYLGLSLATSLAMAAFERRMALRER